MPLPVWGLCVVMFVSGAAIEVFGVNWMTAMHQEIPEEKFSRVSAYDWFGSVSMLPLATALAGPAESAFGRTTALWGCAALVVLVTALVLLVPDVRRMTRTPRLKTAAASADFPTPGPEISSREGSGPAASSPAASGPAGV